MSLGLQAPRFGKMSILSCCLLHFDINERYLYIVSTIDHELIMFNSLQGIVAAENYYCEIIHIIYRWKALDTRKPKIITFFAFASMGHNVIFNLV